MNLLVRDRYLLQHFVAMGESYIKYRNRDMQGRNNSHRIAYRNSVCLSTTRIGRFWSSLAEVVQLGGVL